jgi:hypothetical protein
MAPLLLLLLVTIVGGLTWQTAAHAHAWLATRAHRQYALPTLGLLLSLILTLAVYLLLRPAALLIIGGEATVGLICVYLTNTIHTPWCDVPPRDILLLRAPRRAPTRGTIRAEIQREPMEPPMMRGISPAK